MKLIDKLKRDSFTYGTGYSYSILGFRFRLNPEKVIMYTNGKHFKYRFQEIIMIAKIKKEYWEKEIRKYPAEALAWTYDMDYEVIRYTKDYVTLKTIVTKSDFPSGKNTESIDRTRMFNLNDVEIIR